MGMALVIEVSLLLRDDVIGWGQEFEQVIAVCRVIHDATKRLQFHERLLSSPLPYFSPFEVEG